jgi:hypothetical protein
MMKCVYSLQDRQGYRYRQKNRKGIRIDGIGKEKCGI